jgi:hypothetical protein
MLEIAKSNSEISNNSASLAIATLIINITKLVVAAFAILVTTTPFKLIILIILIIAAPLKHNAYKAIRSYIASSAS